MPSGSEPTTGDTDDLQFEVAEPVPGGPTVGGVEPTRSCVACKRPITSTYFAARDKVLCPNCVAQVNAPPEGSRLLRVLKAAAMGIGAGLLGAAIWYAIRVGAHLQIGLVAVLVGFMVGKSVRKGSGGRGGRGYQVMAVLITYGCIAANYMPDVVQAMADGFHKHKQTAAQVQSSTAPSTQSAIADGSQNSSTGAVSSTTAAKPLHQRTLARTIIGATLAVVLVFTFSLAVPFLDGNVIGLLIIGFALWEAWKFNAPRRLAITGPYQVGANAALPISPGTDGVIV